MSGRPVRVRKKPAIFDGSFMTETGDGHAQAPTRESQSPPPSALTDDEQATKPISPPSTISVHVELVKTKTKSRKRSSASSLSSSSPTSPTTTTDAFSHTAATNYAASAKGPTTKRVRSKASPQDKRAEAILRGLESGEDIQPASPPSSPPLPPSSSLSSPPLLSLPTLPSTSSAAPLAGQTNSEKKRSRRQSTSKPVATKAKVTMDDFVETKPKAKATMGDTVETTTKTKATTTTTTTTTTTKPSPKPKESSSNSNDNDNDNINDNVNDSNVVAGGTKTKTPKTTTTTTTTTKAGGSTKRTSSSKKVSKPSLEDLLTSPTSPLVTADLKKLIDHKHYQQFTAEERSSLEQLLPPCILQQDKYYANGQLTEGFFKYCYGFSDFLNEWQDALAASFFTAEYAAAQSKQELQRQSHNSQQMAQEGGRTDGQKTEELAQTSSSSSSSSSSAAKKGSQSQQVPEHGNKSTNNNGSDAYSDYWDKWKDEAFEEYYGEKAFRMHEKHTLAGDSVKLLFPKLGQYRALEVGDQMRFRWEYEFEAEASDEEKEKLDNKDMKKEEEKVSENEQSMNDQTHFASSLLSSVAAASQLSLSSSSSSLSSSLSQQPQQQVKVESDLTTNDTATKTSRDLSSQIELPTEHSEVISSEDEEKLDASSVGRPRRGRVLKRKIDADEAPKKKRVGTSSATTAGKNSEATEATTDSPATEDNDHRSKKGTKKNAKALPANDAKTMQEKKKSKVKKSILVDERAVIVDFAANGRPIIRFLSKEQVAAAVAAARSRHHSCHSASHTTTDTTTTSSTAPLSSPSAINTSKTQVQEPQHEQGQPGLRDADIKKERQEQWLESLSTEQTVHESALPDPMADNKTAPDGSEDATDVTIDTLNCPSALEQSGSVVARPVMPNNANNAEKDKKDETAEMEVDIEQVNKEEHIKPLGPKLTHSWSSSSLSSLSSVSSVSTLSSTSSLSFFSGEPGTKEEISDEESADVAVDKEAEAQEKKKKAVAPAPTTQPEKVATTTMDIEMPIAATVEKEDDQKKGSSLPENPTPTQPDPEPSAHMSTDHPPSIPPVIPSKAPMPADTIAAQASASDDEATEEPQYLIDTPGMMVEIVHRERDTRVPEHVWNVSRKGGGGVDPWKAIEVIRRGYLVGSLFGIRMDLWEQRKVMEQRLAAGAMSGHMNGILDSQVMEDLNASTKAGPKKRGRKPGKRGGKAKS
ncbi:hypothetical protein BGW42_005001 [Actinomortierella wolfii]|nr:hypothetical protein BGW42_005001 [Actinomortierella wolfii]